MFRNNWTTKSPTVTKIILLLLSIVAIVWLFLNIDNFYVNRNNPGQVAMSFASALMENRVGQATSLVSLQLEGSIESWASTRDQVNCSFPLFGDYGAFGTGRSHSDIDKIIYTYTISLPCPDNEHIYYLAIRDMILQETQDGWQIIEWSSICETWNWEDECAKQQ